MRGSERSLLRQASVLLLAFCLGAAVAPAVAQGGPAPDPAPPRAQTPKPEPVTGARPQPSRPVTTHVSPRQAAPAPAPVVSAPQPPASVQPPAPKQQLARRPAQKRETTRGKPVRQRTAKEAVRRSLPSVSPKTADSPDALLLIGGLALFVLVLCDTVFLTLSTRSLRGAG